MIQMEADEKKHADAMDAAFLTMLRNGKARREAEKGTKYIEAFSRYMCGRDSAYYYNMTYLIRQYEAFCAFLESARSKYNRLEGLYQKVLESSEIGSLMAECGVASKNIKLILNEFLELNMQGEIKLYQPLSMAGGERKQRDDGLMIVCEKQCRSVPLSQGDTVVIRAITEMLELCKREKEKKGGKADEEAGGSAGEEGV